ncbi:MAG: N-acetyltransferase family protein [Chloroflexota bacterium]
MFQIRLATLADLRRIVEIYNQAIATGNANAYLKPFTLEERRDWFTTHTPDSYPIYVCEDDNALVIGYLSLSPYRDRPALARTAEVSYYVDYGQHGIGSALMQYALEDCVRIGKKVLLAIVLEWNAPSIKLLERFGFEKWGTLPDVAEFTGWLCCHLYYGKKV